MYHQNKYSSPRYQTRFSLLIVDDDSGIHRYLKKTLSNNNYDIHSAPNGKVALEWIKDTKFDAALVDLNMPEMDGLSLLKKIRKDFPEIMVIMLTGYGGVKEAVEAIQLGAVDFIEKPFAPERLRARVAQLHQIWKLKEEIRELQAKIKFQFDFEQLVGNSMAMLKLKDTIAQVGLSDASVLIQGETGTGKELVSRAIHKHSRRATCSFIPVACSAISGTVIESELFGHVKGAFTGAHMSTLGLIRSADKGTLFLDEVGELSHSIQVKLLRFIQEKEVRPVGSTQTFRPDVRIICATNRKLNEEMSQKRIREDFFYRLNVVTINVPPLRMRKEDIPLLARHFIKRFHTEFSTVQDIAPEVLVYMENYDWPGNVRELENTIRRAMTLGKGELILPEDLPEGIYASGYRHPRSSHAGESLAYHEKTAIQAALAKSGNNRRKAARSLGISESTLYRKIRGYRL